MSAGDSAGEAGKSSDNVQVAIRCRPLSASEEKAGHSVVVRLDSVRGEVMLTPPTAARGGDKQRVFFFDSVFGFDSQQMDIYNETARPIVDSVLEGYNGRSHDTLWSHMIYGQYHMT